MKTTSHSVMFALVVVLAGQVLAQTANGPAPSADDTVANPWSFSLATSGYLDSTRPIVRIPNLYRGSSLASP